LKHLVGASEGRAEAVECPVRRSNFVKRIA